MFGFPVVALAIALIAIGRAGGQLFLEERRRDQIARRICFVLGIVILVACVGAWFF